MRQGVAVVFPFQLYAEHLGKDLFLIPEGLRRLGFDVELHCPRAEPGVEWPLAVYEAGRDGLARAEQYADRQLSHAIVFSYLHFPRLLTAARDAGLRVVAKADTTGHSVVRAHPRATLTHALHNQPTRFQRGVAVALWLARLGPLAGRDMRDLVRVLTIAATTVVETEGAHRAVRASLARAGAEALADRLQVIPNPVAEPFVSTDVPSERERLVVAIGRWDLRAKDAPLLADALARFRRRRPDHRVVIVGDGGDAVFGAEFERVGRLPQAEIATLMARARIIATSSHWESFSLSSHEGVAMGCSVVGPALQPLRDIVEAGPFGSLASRRRAAELAQAIDDEARAWDFGMREPSATARFWRPRLAIDTIAERYAEVLSAHLQPSSR